MAGKNAKVNNKRKNVGATLIEMIVSFALLGIFLASTVAIIARVTNMYYWVKAETYSKQVSDILLEKMASEIEGAKWWKDSSDNLKIIKESQIEDAKLNLSQSVEAVESADGKGEAVILFDRSDTKVMIYSENKEMVIHYYEIKNNILDSVTYNSTDWKFQESVYNGFKVEEIKFVRGSALSDFLDDEVVNGGSTTTQGKLYRLSAAGEYGNNVVVIFLHMKSDKYGDYYTYRFVKLYNQKEG